MMAGGNRITTTLSPIPCDCWDFPVRDSYLLKGTDMATPPRKPAANRSGSAHLRLNGWLRREQRIRYLSQHPLCAECERQGRVTAATELDHVVALGQGGVANAYDDTGLQGLCHVCHCAKTARELGQRERSACGVDGFPTSPLHHWNKR